MFNGKEVRLEYAKESRCLAEVDHWLSYSDGLTASKGGLS